jgi:hypothetical protein
MNGRLSERLPWCNAINLISGLGGWFCGCAAVVGGFGALCQPPQQFTVYIRANIGNTPSISRMSVLEVPLCFICIGYHWELSDLSREAEKRSNCEIGSNIKH